MNKLPMLILLVALLCVGCVGQNSTVAPEPGLVAPRQLDLEPLKGHRYFETVTKILDNRHQGSSVIKDPMTLMSLPIDENARDKLAVQVDFNKEHLLLMAFHGSSSRRMVSRVEGKGAHQRIVFFDANANGLRTADAGWQAYAFAIGKDVEWSIE